MPSSVRVVRRDRSRSAMFVYGAVTMAILIAIATVALVVTPPGPPALAEFAPRATERIDEALKSQSSSFGDGDGGACADGQDCAAGEGGGGSGVRGTTTTTAGPSRPKVKRCVGDPPRQTEDPQSPPCIGYWEGHNGGSTAKGVTRDEIRVAVTKFAGYDGVQELVEHFNRRYQLYGRSIRIVSVEGGVDPKSAAVQADEEVDAFAVLKTFNDLENLDQIEFQHEARRRKMVSVLPHPVYSTTDDYREMAPYAWAYGPPIDTVQDSVGAMVCSSLAGRQARYAGGDLRVQNRGFAVVVNKARGRTVDFGPLNRALQRCGVPRPRVYDIIGFQDDPGTVFGHYSRMMEDGVTSLLVFADNSAFTNWALKLPPEFQPEIVISGVGTHENEAQWTILSPERRRSLFGVFQLNKLLRAEDTPAEWAYADAGSVPYNEWRESQPTYDAASDYGFTAAYRALLLLASGIQMAGPRLTPQTFAAGLQKARFPNPGAGAAPYYQARVGFGAGDHTMADDAAAVWWDPATNSYGGGGVARRGGWCYVGRGVRFTPQSWTDVEGQLFDQDVSRCR